MLGPTATSQVSISYEEFPEGTVCRVDVGPGKQADLRARWQGGGRPLRAAQQLDPSAQHRRRAGVRQLALAPMSNSAPAVRRVDREWRADWSRLCMALKSRKMRRARWRLSARRASALSCLGAAAGDVVARAGVDAGLGERDHVQGAVELAVAGAVEPVAALLARGASGARRRRRWPAARRSGSGRSGRSRRAAGRR